MAFTIAPQCRTTCAARVWFCCGVAREECFALVLVDPVDSVGLGLSEDIEGMT